MTAPTPNDAPQNSPSAAAGNGGTQQAPQGGQGGQGNGSGENMISQTHMNYLLAEQKREFQGKYGDYDERVRKAEAYDALIATSRSTEEQAADLTAKLATADRDKSDLQTQNLRYRLAGQASLPAELWDMVGGTDEGTIKANIETLRRHMGGGNGSGQESQQQQSSEQQPQQTRQRPAPTPGQGTPSPAGDGRGGGSVGSGRDLYRERNKRSGASKGA